MKSLLLATAALGALLTPVAAADLATRYPVKALVAPAVFSWTGFYIGGNVGYGGGDPSASAVTVVNGRLVSAEEASITSSGFFAGGQIGYNYQLANKVVLGLETDIQWSGINGTFSGAIYDSTGALTARQSMDASVDYFGTIRARLGYAMDRFLPYVTGGAAYGRVGHGASYTDGTSAVVVSGGSTSWGWTLGAGAEYAVTNDWTVKAEYLYVDLGSADYLLSEAATLSASAVSADTAFHTIKAGANYKF